MDRVHTCGGNNKTLIDKTLPNIIFIWSGKVTLGLGFVSPNITLPDQINIILVSVLSNKFITESTKKNNNKHPDNKAEFRAQVQVGLK